MITDPDRYIDAFADAGASMISVHVEVLPHLHRTVHAIKALGVRAGVVLNPATPVVALEEIARDVDFVLVMSVNPGFGGQSFIPNALHKIRRLAELRSRHGYNYRIEVDGGIGLDTVAEVVRAGAEILVAGNAVFGRGDPKINAQNLLKAAVEASLARV